MKLHRVETGERYSDDSGWERRVSLDTHNRLLEIDLHGHYLSSDSDNLNWLIDALMEVRDATTVNVQKIRNMKLT